MAAPTTAVLITGCSPSSIGTGLALAFQAQNIHVFATARSISHLSHLSSLPHIACLVLDVTSSASITTAVNTVSAVLLERSKEIGGVGLRLRYLVNNAGRGLVAPLLDVEEKEAREVFEVNFWGVLNLTRALVPFLLAGMEHGSKEKAVVVNVGSSAGVLPFPWTGIYAASKAATNTFSEVLRLELEPLNINTITIIAGIIRTSFFSSLASYVLPPTSLYQSLKGEVERVASGADVNTMRNVMSAEHFGREVVRDVLAGRKGKTYTGTLGWAVAWMTFLPGWMLDAYGRKRGGMNKFSPV